MDSSTSVAETATGDAAPAEQVTAWLERLDEPELAVLSRRYATATAAAGAVVRKPDGTIVAIPPLLSPEAIPEERFAEMAEDSHGLVQALVRLTGWLMSPAGEPERARLFRSFTPLEAEGLLGWRHAERLATARVDFFLDESLRPRALEVNATIPAMQGYSDVVAESFLRAVGRVRGLGREEIDRLVADNGRNTDDLLASLIEHYQGLASRGPIGSRRAPEGLSIAIVARAGDAQTGELEHYVRRFTELGHRPVIVTPDALSIDGDRLRRGDLFPDLVYRHVFARRLDAASDFARACLRPDVFRILNPLSSQLEVKGMLGYLSPAGAAGGEALAAALGLSDDERRAIARSLPFTRVLDDQRTTGPSGEPIAHLAKTVAGEGERFVVKRSWDYGGKSVFLGAHHDEAAAARAAEVLGRDRPVDWSELVAAAATDERDAWVVQEFIKTRPRRHLVATPTGATWRELYVDLSVYTNLGVSARPRGGASRAAASRIVNILGGGGLAPLVREPVLARLLAER